MSNTLAKSAQNSGEAPDRPFEPHVVVRAQDLSARYVIQVAPNGDTGYVGRVAEMPAVFGLGETDAEALRTTRDLLKWALAYLIEQGRPLPLPRGS